MSLSYFTESEAPRDFRVSSTESDGHYKKCLLCYTVKKNFYCPECIRTGNFIHSSMPYSDRFSEKQAKLLRIKANRRHVLDRCEKLLAPKIKRDTLLTEAKLSRDKIDLLRLAIEQRRNKIDERKKELSELTQHNNELRLKLPRYQKRVSSLGKHAQVQSMELQNKVSLYHDQAQSLAALRRSRIRQLTKYIFPVYMTYDSSDSIEDLEFLGDDTCEEPPKKAQLHIVAPWVSVDGDFSHIDALERLSSASQQGGGGGGAAAGGCGGALECSVAALGLCAQLTVLLAATTDTRLPHTLKLSEYCAGRGGRVACARRLCACVCALSARGGLPPPPAAAPLQALHALATAAAADAPPLGRVESWSDVALTGAWRAWECAGGAAVAAGCADDDGGDGAEGGEDEDAEPEHLTWPETRELESVGSTPPSAPATSLVTSAAASIVSMWRGWTK